MNNYPNYSNQGPSQRGGGKAPKEPKINNGDWTGIVRTRGNSQGDIRFIQWPNGGGVIHFTLEVEEGYTDSRTGEYKLSKDFIPMSASTNKNLNQAVLTSVQPGMRIHVKGKVKNESYTDRNNERRTLLVIQAYAIDFLDNQQQYGPQAGYGQGAPAYGGQPQQGAYPQYGQQFPQQPGAYQQYAPQGAPGYAPQGAPQGGYAPFPQYQPAPAYGQQAPQPYQQQPAQQMPPYQQAPQQGMQGGAPAGYAQGAPVQQQYRQPQQPQPPQQQRQPAAQGGQGAAAPVPASSNEDMPDFGAGDRMPVHEINV